MATMFRTEVAKACNGKKNLINDAGTAWYPPKEWN